VAWVSCTTVFCSWAGALQAELKKLRQCESASEIALQAHQRFVSLEQQMEACKAEISEKSDAERQLEEEHDSLTSELSEATRAGNPDSVAAALFGLQQNEDAMKEASAALAAAKCRLFNHEKAARSMEVDAFLAEQDLELMAGLSEHDQCIASLKLLLEPQGHPDAPCGYVASSQGGDTVVHAPVQHKSVREVEKQTKAPSLGVMQGAQCLEAHNAKLDYVVLTAQGQKRVPKLARLDRVNRERELAMHEEAKAVLQDAGRLASTLRKHKEDAQRHKRYADSAERRMQSMHTNVADLRRQAVVCEISRQQSMSLGHLEEASIQQRTASELKAKAEKEEQLAATVSKAAAAATKQADECCAAGAHVQKQLILAKRICSEAENDLLATKGELQWTMVARLAEAEEANALAEAERELDRALEAEQQEQHTLTRIVAQAGNDAAQCTHHSAQVLKAQACTAWAASAAAQTAAAAARSRQLSAESSAACCREDSIVARKHLTLLRAAMSVAANPKQIHDEVAAAKKKHIEMQKKSSEFALAATRLRLHATGIRKQALAHAAVGDHQASSASVLRYRELFALAAAAQARFVAAASDSVCASADLQSLRKQSTVQDHVLGLIAAMNSRIQFETEHAAALRCIKAEIVSAEAAVAASKRDLAHHNLQKGALERQAQAANARSVQLEACGHVQNAAAASNESHALQMQSDAIARERCHVNKKLEEGCARLHSAEVRLHESKLGRRREQAMAQLLLQALLLVVEIGQSQQETGSLQCRHQLAVLQV
jgi:hypothetical protein